MPNLIGQSLGRYHILEQLGEGGMATVYEAYDTRLEREVAIKIIRRDAFPVNQLERILKRFEREAKALAKLSHPNIIKVIDYGEHEGSPYLIMEYLPGGTLKQKLGKPIPWQEATQLLIPIAEALDYAHSQNMIHRDVKPSNILLTQRGQPMLTDFGIAKVLDLEETQDLTGTSAAMGTPEYMAPEQATAKTVDRRADIYALGIVFYEMVTGRKPYIADTPMAVLIKQATEPLPRPKQYASNLPDGVEKVLLKALAKKPEDRYQSMDDFAGALERLSTRRNESRKVREKEHEVGSIETKVSKQRVTILVGSIVSLMLIGGLLFWFRSLPTSERLGPTISIMRSLTPTLAFSQVLSPPPSLTPPFTFTPISSSPLSSTPEPTNIPMGADIPSVQSIVRTENFDDLSSGEFEVSGNYGLSNGILTLQNPVVSGNDPWVNGSSYLNSNFPIKQGNGYLLLYQTQPGAYFLITLEHGPFNDSSYRAFWFDNGKDISVWSGPNQIVDSPLNLNYQSDTWYYLLMWLNNDSVQGKIWEKDHPEVETTFHADTGNIWASSRLNYKVQAVEGILEIDEFQELEFSK